MSLRDVNTGLYAMWWPGWQASNFLCAVLLAYINSIGWIVEAVPGCSVFFLPDFKWKKAICESPLSRLTQIPLDLPANLIDLQVKDQNIPVLTEIGLTPLQHLETLHIESSGVSRIAVGAFRTLSKLKHLNLRNNSLRLGHTGFPREILYHLTQLTTLNLAENPLDIVPDAFFASNSVSQLHSLWLGFTKSISVHIDPMAFTHLNNLVLLDLSFSKLSTLPVAIEAQLKSMTDLRHLYIGGNPWHCDCKLRWLHVWLKANPAILGSARLDQYDQQRAQQSIDPICFSPALLRDRTLGNRDIMDTDFRCAPKMITKNQNLTVPAQETLSLSCEFYSDPVSHVSWYRDGKQVYNSSKTGLTQYRNGETYLSVLHISSVESTDAGLWTCTMEDRLTPLSVDFHVTVTPRNGWLPLGMTVTQQRWMYAGLGAGVLFIILTTIGVGIFYCCDPRSKPQQSLQRWVSKRQADRLHSCYGCAKLSANHPKDVESSEHDCVIKEGKRSGRSDRSDQLDLQDSPIKQICSPPQTSPTKSVTIRSGGHEQQSFHTARPSLHSPSSLDDGRLFVSCDGPEPTVLLATKFPLTNEVVSSVPLYGIHGNMNLGIETTFPNNSNPLSGDYATRKTFQSPLLVPTLKPSYQYARVIQTTSQPSSTQNNVSLPLSSNGTYTTPCPVHGSIVVDRLKDSSKKYEKDSRILTNGCQDYTALSCMSDGEKQSTASLSAQGTLNTHYVRKQNSLSTRYGSDCRNNSIKNRNSYFINRDKTSSFFQQTHDSVEEQSGLGHRPRSFANVHSLPHSVRFDSNRYLLKDDHSHEQLVFPFSCNKQYGSHTPLGQLQTKPTLLKPDVLLDEGSDNSPDHNSDEGDEVDTWESSSTSSTTPPADTCSTGSSRNEAVSSNLTLSPGSSFPVRHRGSWCRVHYPTWRGYASQLISPASGSVHSTGYNAATLPTSFSQKTRGKSLVILDNYRNTSSQRHSRDTSQTLIRPGSKHKLDTDSGTDYND